MVTTPATCSAVTIRKSIPTSDHCSCYSDSHFLLVSSQPSGEQLSSSLCITWPHIPARVSCPQFHPPSGCLPHLPQTQTGGSLHLTEHEESR